MKRSLLVCVVLTLAVLAGGPALAQKGKEGPMAKLPQSLVTLHEQYSSRAILNGQAPLQAASPLVNVVEDRVVIDAVADGDVETLKAELIALGMQNAVAFGRMVSGQLPIASLPAAAALASLRFAQAPVMISNVGLVTSQGDKAQRSDVARSTFGVDGTGVKVGVLSDSFNCLGAAPTNVTNGDLSPVTVVQERPSCTGATDEGRAMLQIVHDVAPGATLVFATGSLVGEAGFAANIKALRNNGANVIVDDLYLLNEPMFQDGDIAQAVNTVVASGAAYFSAAGNYGRNAYQAPFRNSGIDLGMNGIGVMPTTDTYIAHDFDPGPGIDLFETITVSAGQTRFVFQWADRYFKVSGTPGAATDLDIAVFDMAGNFRGGAGNLNVGKDPIEMEFFDLAAPTQFQIAIVKFQGPDPSLIKFVSFDGGIAFNEHPTNSGAIFGHANAVGAVAVGAARYDQTPAFGVSPPVLEPYSSAGTTPIFFDVAGNPINDPRAFKPEIVAPDCADTTFLNAGPNIEGNAFPNFCGTSAAAPHAAGVAALILQKNPALTPAQVYSAIKDTALDMGAPGFDSDSGFGLIRADAAVNAVSGDTTPPTVSTKAPTAGASGVATNTTVTATFSEALDATTVNTNTFALRDALNNPVPAAVGYDAGTRTARLTPSRPLASLATYRATLKGGPSGIKDAAGNALAADFTWSFTTAVGVTLRSAGEIISYVPAAAAPAGYVSFVRVANRGTAATPVYVELLDETTGQVTATGPLIAGLAPQAAVTFDAFAIESAMGVSLPAAQRPRLRLLGSTSLEFQSYMSNPGGVVSNLTSSDTGLSVDVASYIPAAVSASGYTSFVRIANRGGAATPVKVSVLDGSTGAASAPQVVIPSLVPGAARTLSSAALEAALGTSLPGNARPRLRVSGSAQLEVQSYMSNPGGVVTNLSTTQSGNTVDVISYVPAAVSASGYTSFIRVANTGVSPTAVSAALVQEGGTIMPAQTLIASLAPGAAITLSAQDCESALYTSLPAGDRPRIRLTAAQPLQVQSYMANPGGVVSNLTNLVTGTTLEVISYVPAAVSASGYTSFVRVANKGSSSTSVRGSVINDDGSVGLTGTLISTLAPRASVTLSSAQIEAALGTFLPAASRPRLRIQSAVELEVQSYMSNLGGVVENLTDARSGP